MAMKVKLPVGIENFEEIRTAGFYYVDKTGLIRDLLENYGKVNLFTRPRRFGKTLNMSMLKYFLSMDTTEGFLMGWIFQEKRNYVTGTWEIFRLFLSV